MQQDSGAHHAAATGGLASPDGLSVTGPFATQVRRAGRSDLAVAVAPEGGRILRSIAAGLVAGDQSSDRVLN
ncbi:hypothetical protein GCM10027053_26120 [Intrasporangium mesophilum]